MTATGFVKLVLKISKKCSSLKLSKKKGKAAVEQHENPWANLKGGAYVSSEKFMRNSFPIRKGEKVLFVYRQKIDMENFEVTGYQNTKLHDAAAAEKTVHFFIYDDNFESNEPVPKIM
jgi:hypothetical protein